MQSIVSKSASILRESLKDQVSSNAYSMWLAPLKFDDGDGLVKVLFPSKMLLQHFEESYLQNSKNILKAAGLSVAIELRVDQALAENQSVLAAEDSVVRQQPSDPIQMPSSLPDLTDINGHFTFEEFIVGPDNRMAFASCMAVANEASKQYNPLFLHGSTGLGKTHLLQAICNHIRSEDPSCKVVYTNCEAFTNEFIEAIKTRHLDSFRNHYRSVDILIVDDVQFLANKSSTQEEFFHTFNDLIGADKQVIISSDSSPLELIKFEDRLISRFSSGLVAAIETPQFETRLAIIQQKCKRLDLELDSSMMEFFAQRPITNVRELSGALITLDAHKKFNAEKISVELLKQLFPQYFDEDKSTLTVVDFDSVLEAVTAHFKVRLQDLQSKKRPHSIAYPRQIAMYLLRKLTHHSLEEIGAFLGGRDHSTVQYAQVKIEGLREKNVELHSLLSQLEDIILLKTKG